MRHILALLLSALAFSVLADQTAIPNYHATQSSIFWDKLYPTGGRTLYCDQEFKGHAALNIEHVYAAAWMAQALGCSSRTACRTDPAHKERFNHMEADLHNLYPAMGGINGARSNDPFGIIADGQRSLVICDFEVDKTADIAEPRPGARGNIARAIFYMHHEYGLPIPFGMTGMLKQWNHDDPPSTEEIWRNDAIARLEGVRNPFIDDPSLADGL